MQTFRCVIICCIIIYNIYYRIVSSVMIRKVKIIVRVYKVILIEQLLKHTVLRNNEQRIGMSEVRESPVSLVIILRVKSYLTMS